MRIAALTPGLTYYPKLKAIVKAAILESWARNNGNLCAIAFELGVGRVTLYRHLKAYGVKCVRRAPPPKRRKANGQYEKA